MARDTDLCRIDLLPRHARGHPCQIHGTGGQQILTSNVHDAIVATLSFIDLTLIANLVLIVLYTGYSSFVSRLNIDEGTVKANETAAEIALEIGLGSRLLAQHLPT